MNITDRFTEDIYNFSRRDISPQLLHEVKRCLTDYAGCAIAGAAQVGERLKSFPGEGSYKAAGFDGTVSFDKAVLLNGYASHVMETDDGHRFAMLHMSAPVISALLVAAQREKLDFTSFARGVITGFEAAARLAEAMQPGHKNKGYHATGTCGACGTAVAVAAALGFTREEMKNALSAAAATAGGLLEAIEGASQLKPYNVASAAHNGITAAYFAAAGFAAPEDMLGGRRGLFAVTGGEIMPEKLQIHDGDPYAIMRRYIKPYAACRHCHAPIAGALSLRSKYGAEASEISAVGIQTYKLAVLGHDGTDITSPNAAKMSIPYSVAAALIYGRADTGIFGEPYISDTATAALAKKVTVTESAELTALCPGIRGADVTLRLTDGREYNIRIEHPPGEPENPIGDTELEEKLSALAQLGGKTPEQARELLSMINNAENDFTALVRKL